MKVLPRNSAVDSNDALILNMIKKEGNMEGGMRLLMKTHQNMLYQHIRRMVENHVDTDDILQNVFIKAYRAIDRFEGKSKLSTWLYRIATNETLTFLKKNKIGSGGIYNEEQIGLLRADTEVDGNEITSLLNKAIKILPEKQKLVFTMRYYDEMTYDQISKVLNVSVGGLKASFHHAVKKVEAYVKENQIT